MTFMEKWFLSVCFLLCSAFVFSQRAPVVLKDTISFDEVVVTGSPAKVNKNYVPLSVSVVNNEQISNSGEASLLPALNGLVPGLFVTERGVTGFGVSTGAAGQITLRGIGGSPTTGVLMLIDGHPQFMGLFGHPLSDSYRSSDVEKVEIIRGPASMLYGSNAVGGVINIITRQQKKEGFDANLNAMYGSYNTQKYSAGVGFKKNKLGVYASFNHDQTDGHRPHSDFKINNGYVKLTYDVNRNFKFNTDLSISKFKTSDPGPDTTNALPGNTLDITRGYWAMSIDNEFDRISGSTRVFYNWGKHIISDGFLSHDVNYGFNVHESVSLFKGNLLSVGAEYTDYGGKAENTTAMGGKGMIFKDTTLYEAGLYVFMQQSVFEKFTLNAGLRLHHHEVYGNEWVPSAGFAYQLSINTVWKASLSKGFRSPTIQELYMWTHNSNLNPERVMNYETGIHQSFFNRKLDAEATIFYVKGNNLIITVPMQGLQNAGSVSNKGIELAVNAHPVDDLSINFSYSYINMENPVYATPRHNLYASCYYLYGKFGVMTSVQYINHLDTDASSLTYFQNYVVWNTRLSYTLSRNAQIYVDGHNLLDQKYQVNHYYPMPGTTLFVGLKLSI
jgi:outer membrane cobalamin receptor